MKRLLVLENRFEGDLLSDALRREGIPCLIRSFEDKAYDGLYVSQKGWGEVLVHEEDFERAKEVARGVLKGYR